MDERAVDGENEFWSTCKQALKRGGLIVKRG